LFEATSFKAASHEAASFKAASFDAAFFKLGGGPQIKPVDVSARSPAVRKIVKGCLLQGCLLQGCSFKDASFEADSAEPSQGGWAAEFSKCSGFGALPGSQPEIRNTLKAAGFNSLPSLGPPARRTNTLKTLEISCPAAFYKCSDFRHASRDSPRIQQPDSPGRAGLGGGRANRSNQCLHSQFPQTESAP
jgi:hypothetical protein